MPKTYVSNFFIFPNSTMLFRILWMFPSNNVLSHFLNQIMHIKHTIHNSYESFLSKHLYPYFRIKIASFKYLHCYTYESPPKKTCNIQE
ncbi:hypothetical protein HanPSC8_Chr04g0136221 [Helianthus annuus]|nr:hypothetical protein HanPSC8_Chr04g0136221 [Helianthus annuus]